MGKKQPCEHPSSAQKVDPRTGRITCRNCGATLGYDLTGRRSTLGNGEYAMNLRNAVLIVLVLALSIIAGAATAYADAPQPFVYPMVKCSGLPVATLVQAEQQFDSEYGWTHGLVTDWQWKASFEARVNEFAALLGCPQVLDNGALTRWYKFYVPTYSRILRGEIP